MQTWKNPITVLLASAGLLVSSAIPQLALGQSAFPSHDGQEDSRELNLDSPPLSAPYLKEARPAEQATESTDESGSPLADQTISSLPPTNPQTPASQDLPSGLNADSNALVAPLAQADPRASEVPTVIVRPPANNSFAASDLTVNVEPIASSNNQEFAVRLMVPDSVKIVEVTPYRGADSRHDFKIRVEQESLQPTDKQPAGAVVSTDTFPMIAPVHPASSLHASQSNSRSKPPEPGPLPQIKPSNDQPPVSNGFIRNPFFPSDGKQRQSQKQPIAMAPKNSRHPGVLTAMLPPIVSPVDQTEASQASYRTTFTDSFAQQTFDRTTQQMSFVDSVEPGTTIQSAMFGPARMGLGETANFAIRVSNPSADSVNDLTVRLDVPAGLEVVVLDRAAQIDQDARTLTWQIPAVNPEQEHFIHYRVRSLSEGIQLQQAWASNGRTEFGNSRFETVVDLEFTSSDSPSLIFESK